MGPAPERSRDDAVPLNGTFVGLPPTGKLAEITRINFFRLGADGKIVERFGSFDALGIMQQIGLAPSPGGH